MKNLCKSFGIITVAVIVVFSLLSCGGNDPKALAKQSFDLLMQSLEAIGNAKKTEELNKKAEKIEAKVAKLSAADRKIYEDELARLTGSAARSVLDNLMIEDSDDALNEAVKILDNLFNELENTGAQNTPAPAPAAKPAASTRPEPETMPELLNDQTLQNVQSSALDSINSRLGDEDPFEAVQQKSADTANKMMESSPLQDSAKKAADAFSAFGF